MRTDAEQNFINFKKQQSAEQRSPVVCTIQDRNEVLERFVFERGQLVEYVDVRAMRASGGRS